MIQSASDPLVVSVVRAGSAHALAQEERMKARDLMTPGLDVVTSQNPLSQAAQVMRDRNVGSVPVVESRDSMRPQGIITDRDIVVRHVAEGHDRGCTVSAHMTKGPIETVDENDDLEKVMNTMKRAEVRRVLVTGQGGRLVGIIAQADLATSDQVPMHEMAVVLQTISESTRPGR
jgi:CBS domain-containing protein